MAKILIVYYSRGGNTRKMAEFVKEGVLEAGGTCNVVDAEQADVNVWPQYDGVILGSPVYYGHPAAPLKQVIDDSVKQHGKLTGKVAGAFATCGVAGGGAETTVRALIDAMMIHGMIVQGTASGPHYGPVCVGKPDDAAAKHGRDLGKRVAELAEKVISG